MKFAVSMALVLLLLGMPLGCIFSTSPAAHPCCPRTSANLKCPYDLFDSAKASSHVVAATVLALPTAGIAPQIPTVAEDLPLSIAATASDLYIFHRVLRI